MKDLTGMFIRNLLFNNFFRYELLRFGHFRLGNYNVQYVKHFRRMVIQCVPDEVANFLISILSENFIVCNFTD